jgi:hypothetical protein
MTFALQQSDIPTLPIAPAQICNPLNHEWINVPIDEARPIRPMDVIILATLFRSKMDLDILKERRKEIIISPFSFHNIMILT